MTKLRLFALCGAIAGTSILTGFILGHNHGKFQAALEENKCAASFIQQHSVPISKEMREYLKGRIYYNIASKYPSTEGYLLAEDWDLGPVDLSIFKGRRPYAKDPGYPCNDFTSAKANAKLLLPPPPTQANQSLE